MPRFLTFFYFAQRFLFFKKVCIKNPIKSFKKYFWNHRKEVIGHSDVFYLFSPKILNKKFLTNIFDQFNAMVLWPQGWIETK